MKENNNIFDKIIFVSELILVLFIPLIIWSGTTPTNVLNSNSLFETLWDIAIFGSGLIFFIGIPVGIVGIINAKKMIKLRKITIALSIINLIAGIIEVFMLISIFYAVIVKGASV